VLVVVSFVTFVLLDIMPGDAAQTLVGEFASEEQLAQVRQEMGLDATVLERYARYTGQILLQGDMGDSLISGRPVSTLIRERFPHTLMLTVTAMLVAVLLGTAIGMLAASRPGSYLDTALMSVTTLGLSIPTFWLALLLILVFSLKLRWLPVVGAGSPAHLVLPTICLALPLIAIVARLIRSSLLDVKSADYVRTAHAKGLRRRLIWRNHILRNGLIPVITVLGLHAGHLLAGAFIIETIFGWPGLGRLTVQAILDADFPIVLGAVILIAVIYQFLNLSVDLAHAALDPRVGQKAL
jgi:ABC-type dipeptide/oligopeptide/nickel transport system permease component